MSGTGKHVCNSVLRRSPTQQQQQNGTYSGGGKVTKPPQSRGARSSKIVLAPMNGESMKTEEGRSSGMRGRSSSFGKEEMNLMAVRKVDQNVTHILSTVSQVMLYQYDQTSGEWERTSIEGTLFICSRSTAPSNGFMILNRLNNENMLEEIAPNMEFRVQNPFVLFKKKTGNIFGLCFQEESTCQETGQLLNSLGTQENHLPVVGHSSPRSQRNPSLNASMRSTSAPAFKQPLTSSANGKPYLVDVLENGNYTSSEGENTSSPDSLTSDPISFVVAAPPPTSSSSSTHPAGIKPAHHGKHKLRDQTTSPVSQKQRTKPSTPGKNSIQSSSSQRNVSSSKGGSTGQGQRSQQPAFSSGSVSPSRGRSRSPKQQRRQQNGNGGGVYNLSSSVGGGGGPRARGEMRHAASFDHGFTNTTSPLRSFTAPTTTHQQQYDVFSPQQVQQPSSAFELLAAKVSGQQQLQQRQQQLPMMDKAVRRLFTADTSSGATLNPPLLESVPTSLQSIFSQVSTSTADSTTNSNPPLAAANGTGGDDLPLKVISLEQVEQQMVADVPSPVSINPLTLFSGSITVSSAAPYTSTQPSSSAAITAAKPSEASQQHHILLQPSAFLANAANGTTVVNPPVSSVAISVEPPSPVVAPGTILANGGSTPSSNLKTQLFPEGTTPPPSVTTAANQDQFFPPIPPVMHSPGMRAAPVSRVNQPKPSQPQQQSREEPSSLVSTAVSAPHVAQNSAAITVSLKGAGKPSQQISSTTTTTTIEERRPPQTTPQRYSSQSTPSLTPLAELSIPRRSTTAPTGLPPSTTSAAGALMSPHQFAHSTSTTVVAGTDSASDGGHAQVGEGSKVTTKGAEPVGLSRDQLQQALLYLIKHDDGFLSRLHEAYQLSLSEKQV